jgi:type II secretory pathway pseudopilin PulG
MSKLRRFRSSQFADERGISLIELLIAITITTIISGALVGSIYFGFRATSTTQTQLTQSAKANVLASYFVEDAQNATGVGKNVTESTAACGSGATPVAVLFTNDTTTPSQSSVSYYTATVNNSLNVYRRTCDGGTPRAPSLVIKGLRPNTLTLTCTPFNPATGACVNSNPSNGIPDWTSVTISLIQQDASGKNPYAVTLVGSKRVS